MAFESDPRSSLALGSAVRVASKESQNLLEEVAARIRWEDHLHLTRRAFADLVAVAISDELEGADDLAVGKLLKSMSLDEAREHADYRPMRERARKLAKSLAIGEETYADWLTDAAIEARRVMRRAISGRSTLKQQQAATEILDRANPKPRREDSGPKGFILTSEQVDALRSALALNVTPAPKRLEE